MCLPSMVIVLAGLPLLGASLLAAPPSSTHAVPSRSNTTAQLEVIPTNIVPGATVLIHVTVADEQGIDDWYCVPRIGERLFNDLRFGDFWTRGFERPKSVNRFYERKLDQPGEYDFFVTAWDAQRTPRESNHVKVRVVSPGKAPQSRK